MRILSFIVFFLSATKAAQAGLYEFLSESSYQLVKGSCPVLDAGDQVQQIQAARKACLSAPRPAPLFQLNDQLEDSFFSLLADRSKEDFDCNFISYGQFSYKQDWEELEKKGAALAEIKDKLARLNADLNMYKVKLPRRPKWEGGELIEDERYQTLSSELKRNLAAYSAIAGSISYFHEPNVEAALINFGRTADRQALVHAYREIEVRLGASWGKLWRNPARFDRHLKEQLMSDPTLINSLFAKKPELKAALTPILCQMDAKYGAGARIRDIGLTASSLVVGGVTLKALTSAGGTLASALSATRGSRFLSPMTTKILLGASVGISSIDVYKNLDKACLSGNTSLAIPKKCDDSSLAVNHHQESCLLSLALTSLYVEGNTGFATRALMSYLKPFQKPPGSSFDATRLEQSLAKVPDAKSPHSFPTTGIEVEMQIPKKVGDDKVALELEALVRAEGGQVVERSIPEGWGDVTIKYLKNGQVKFLKVKRDSSIKTTETMRDAELVSQIIEDEKDTALFLKSVERMRELGAQPHQSAGLHVHSGAQNLTVAEAAALQEAFRQLEGELVHAFRQMPVRSRYAGRTAPQDIQYIKRRAASDPNGDFTRMSPGLDRYRNLNLSAVGVHGTAETRLFNSTLNPEAISLMRDLSGSLMRAVRNKDSRLVDYFRRLEKGERFDMKNLSHALGMKVSNAEVEHIMATISREANRMVEVHLTEQVLPGVGGTLATTAGVASGITLLDRVVRIVNDQLP